MVTLTSAHNPLLKEIRRAIRRGSLTESGLAVAEGFHLLEEAMRSGSEIDSVLVAVSARKSVPELNGRVVPLDDALFREISSTGTSQGVITLVRPPQWKLEDVFAGETLVVILDGIQDPGNAGTILRAAEAFGATGAALLKGSANPYSPKALRASAGSAFRLPLIAGLDEGALRSAMEGRHLKFYSAMPNAAASLNDCDLASRCAILIGGEGQGVRSGLREIATDVRIPTSGVESLNAALAAGIFLYEARGQRMGR